MSTARRIPLQVLDENALSPARVNRSSSYKEQTKANLLRTSSDLRTKNLLLGLAFTRAAIRIQNKRIAFLEKKLAFQKLCHASKQPLGRTNNEDESNFSPRTDTITTPKKRRLVNDSNLPESAEKSSILFGVSPTRFARLKIGGDTSAGNDLMQNSPLKNLQFQYEVTQLLFVYCSSHHYYLD